MGILSEWSEKNNKFIVIKTGCFYEGVFEGARIVVSSFDAEKETIQYKIDGKIFNCASRKLAELMDSVAIGSVVRIGKTGETNKTRYSLDVIKLTTIE